MEMKMSQKQIDKMKEQGWPEPKFEVGDNAYHVYNEVFGKVTHVEVDEKWLNDYGVKGWTYIIDAGFWGRDDDYEAC